MIQTFPSFLGKIMHDNDFGQEICTVKPSYKMLIIWMVISIIPLSICIQQIIKFKQLPMPPVVMASIPMSFALYHFIRAYFNKLKVFERGVQYTTIFGTKAMPLNANTEIVVSQVVTKGLRLPISHDLTLIFKNGKQKISVTENDKRLEPVFLYLKGFR